MKKRAFVKGGDVYIIYTRAEFILTNFFTLNDSNLLSSGLPSFVPNERVVEVALC